MCDIFLFLFLKLATQSNGLLYGTRTYTHTHTYIMFYSYSFPSSAIPNPVPSLLVSWSPQAVFPSVFTCMLLLSFSSSFKIFSFPLIVLFLLLRPFESGLFHLTWLLVTNIFLQSHVYTFPYGWIKSLYIWTTFSLTFYLLVDI